MAAAAEAKKLGITFVGHVPDAIRASEASEAGQKSIEHFTGIFEGASTIEDQLIVGPKSLGVNVKTFDPERARRLVELMAKNQTWQVPTLVWERGQWLVDAIDKTHDPLTKYAPHVWKDQTWPMFVREIMEGMDTDPLPVRQHFVQMELEMTLAMYRAGVPFMAGTDTAAGVHVFPGFSLHEELALFVKAGPDAAAGAADRHAESGALPRSCLGHGQRRRGQGRGSRLAGRKPARRHQQHAADPWCAARGTLFRSCRPRPDVAGSGDGGGRVPTTHEAGFSLSDMN